MGIGHPSSREMAAVAVQAGPGAEVAVAEELPLAISDRVSPLEAVDQEAEAVVAAAFMVVRGARPSVCNCPYLAQRRPRGDGDWPFRKPHLISRTCTS